MINSHKEFVEDVKKFVEKFDFISDFIYNVDAQNLDTQIENLQSRGLILNLLTANLDDDYNYDYVYGFSIVADSGGSVEEVINAEEENLFSVSALDDYLNHVLDSPVTFSNLETASEGTASEARTAITGTITFTTKRSGSYWKVMDSYAAG